MKNTITRLQRQTLEVALPDVKRFALVVWLFFIFVVGNAQQQQTARVRDFENYRAHKISYMTEKLELTPSEAQLFWPTYNEFDKKRFDLHRQRRDLEKKVEENLDKYSESEFRKINAELVDLFRKEADLIKEYNGKFMKLLPVRKVVMIGPVENDFRYKVIREFEFRKEEK